MMTKKIRLGLHADWKNEMVVASEMVVTNEMVVASEMVVSNEMFVSKWNGCSN